MEVEKASTEQRLDENFIAFMNYEKAAGYMSSNSMKAGFI